MKRVFFEGPARFIFFPIAAVAFLSLISFVVMQLWNHLLPDILHVTAINFWQAMGIFILSKILFGFSKGGRKFGPDGAPWMMRKRMGERFKNMTPEQKEAFKRKMKERMCGYKGQFGRRGFDNFWVDLDEEENVKPEGDKTQEQKEF
ncbi:hypothetical protein [Mucilaginibacter agri]|uniref:hypothetical protein n=1 Tax=Mucilaginibacter agri TaxID=2695265 RepID=UPI001AA1C249|nr:hypothetical protein [Mucilaginibacter agri]